MKYDMQCTLCGWSKSDVPHSKVMLFSWNHFDHNHVIDVDDLHWNDGKVFIGPEAIWPKILTREVK